MSEINQAYNDRVRYTIQNRHLGSLVITEPIGWKDDDKELNRDDKYHGIFITLSNNLKFIDDGFDFLEHVYKVYGINENVRLIKEEKHPKTDEFTRSYDGYLDMSTYKKEGKQISIKFNSGGIEAVLKSRENEQVEITRETSLDGKVLDPLSVNEVELDGRKILLQTSYEVKETENSVYMSNYSNGNTRGSTETVPLVLVNKSHEEAQNPIIGATVGDNSWDRHGSGETGIMFLAVSDEPRTLRIRFKINFRTYFENENHPILGNIVTGFDDVNHFRFWFRLAVYKDSSNYNHKENYILFTTNKSNEVHYKNRTITFDDTIDIDAGDSLALVFDQNADLGSNSSRGHLKTHVDQISLDYFEIIENSFFEKSISKVILPHEVAERLIEIYTGDKALYSDVLGRTDIGYQIDGKASLNAITHGLWIRGFDQSDEVFKPLTTSLKEFMESYGAVWNLGLGIEKLNFREKVRIEDLSYFYNRNTTIKLPYKVKKVKRSVSTKHFFSSVEIGYEKGGDYEEAFGLDEYNGKTNYVTIFTRFKNVFQQISKYRADSYGLEFCRRKPKSRYDTVDSSYDNDKFIIDLKRGIGSIFNIRKWQDDFEVEPTGTFSPETAYNLRLSPFNCMLRHGWEISAGLTKNLTEYLRYTSSTASSRLKTKLFGKPEYAENDDIINSELQRARYEPEIIEFEHEVTFDLSKQLLESTNILGKEIPNMYGCIEFINEDGDLEKGFLLSLKPNKEGNWKLLKAY